MDSQPASEARFQSLTASDLASDKYLPADLVSVRIKQTRVAPSCSSQSPPFHKIALPRMTELGPKGVR